MRGHPILGSLFSNEGAPLSRDLAGEIMMEVIELEIPRKVDAAVSGFVGTDLDWQSIPSQDVKKIILILWFFREEQDWLSVVDTLDHEKDREYTNHLLGVVLSQRNRFKCQEISFPTFP